MKKDNLILVATICDCYSLESSFLDQLEHHGIVEIIYIGQSPYIREDHLAIIEKVMRIHYDLQVNVDGVAVILDLMERINSLQDENQRLKRKIKIQ